MGSFIDARKPLEASFKKTPSRSWRTKSISRAFCPNNRRPHAQTRRS